MIVQIFLLGMIVAAFALTWRRARQQAIRRVEAWAWSLVWIVAAIVVLRPEVASTVARFVGVGRGSDLVLYATTIILLVLVFQLHVAHERLERQLTELIRREALKDVEQENTRIT